MDISVKFAGGNLSEAEKESIWKILVDCDGDFYPPLSSRESSHQARLGRGNEEASGEKVLPRKYFDEMIRQDFILAYADGEIAGFLTFRRNYTCDALAATGPSLYITTICVSPLKRRLGIMSALYSCLEDEVAPSLSANVITTRTWSLNTAQLHTLAKRGYSLVARLPDDRGPGIDTVYFAK